MKKIPFSSKDRYIIAEFVYGYTENLLIKSDAADIVKVLFRNEILFNINSWLKDIEENDDRVATRLIDLLYANVSKEEITEIMAEYYGTKKLK